MGHVGVNTPIEPSIFETPKFEAPKNAAVHKRDVFDSIPCNRQILYTDTAIPKAIRRVTAYNEIVELPNRARKDPVVTIPSGGYCQVKSLYGM